MMELLLTWYIPFKDGVWKTVYLYFLKILIFFYFKLIFLVFLNSFYVLILKINFKK
jgi:hypothetical protein